MKKIILGLGVLAFMVSCNNDDDNPIVEPRGDYENGVIVLNEGAYGAGNASVSFIKNEEITNEIYASANSTSEQEVFLGDTAQSLSFNDDLAYIVLNGSNKIEVVNRYTFESVTTITDDLANPRYVAFANGKAYVTNWGDGSDATDDFVTVVNLNNYSTDKISVGQGPEKILEENGKLYVAHKGGFSQENFLTVINSEDDTVDMTITVGDVPNSMVKSGDDLYVLCGGNPSYAVAGETAATLYNIKFSDNTATSLYTFENGAHPSNMVGDSGMGYLTLGNSVYSVDLSNPTSFNSFETESTYSYGIYGLAVNDGKIYIGDAASDFASSGKVYVYNTDGTLDTEYTAGVGPNGFYFNN